MSYLRFGDLGIPPGQKTRRWSVFGLSGGQLGEIRFYGAWRKYCFFPGELTTFDSVCLREAADFCEKMTEAWRLDVRAK